MSAITELFANNAGTTLAAPLVSTATSLTVASGTGALFPNPNTGLNQFFRITLVDALTGLVNEICFCTARTADVMTIIRAQEGTAADNWLAGDSVSSFITDGTMTNLVQAGASVGVKATPGWRNNPDGTITQWGSGTLPASAATTSTLAVTFPVAFTSGVWAMQITPYGSANSSTGGQPTTGAQGAPTLTGFTAKGDTLGYATFNQTVAFTWEATGI